MVTLQPAHPVYAAQEDAYQRDRQAESEAGAYFERYLSHFRRLPLTPSERSLLARLEDEIMDALADAFVDGWNAAREQQRIG